MRNFRNDWANLLAHAMEHAEGIGKGALWGSLGVALVVFAWKAGPEAGALILWVLRKVPWGGP